MIIKRKCPTCEDIYKTFLVDTIFECPDCNEKTIRMYDECNVRRKYYRGMPKEFKKEHDDLNCLINEIRDQVTNERYIARLIDEHKDKYAR